MQTNQNGPAVVYQEAVYETLTHFKGDWYRLSVQFLLFLLGLEWQSHQGTRSVVDKIMIHQGYCVIFDLFSTSIFRNHCLSEVELWGFDSVNFLKGLLVVVYFKCNSFRNFILFINLAGSCDMDNKIAERMNTWCPIHFRKFSRNQGCILVPDPHLETIALLVIAQNQSFRSCRTSKNNFLYFTTSLPNLKR